MFTQYCSPIFSVINVHGKDGHGYADDHQVYSGCDPVCIASETVSMEACARDIKSWMRNMKLKMNDSKTEYILIGTPHQLAKCSQSPITIGDSVIPPSNHVRNLGAYFDKHMSMAQHIKIKCQAAYAQLYNISKIRKYLDDSSAHILIHALVHSHLDYCNSLLTGLPNRLVHKLQLVQNSAARVLCQVSKREHIRPVLKRLHWLPIMFRIRFKVCVITFKALHESGPAYIRDMLKIKRSLYSLRSSAALTLEVPKTRHETLGDRSFMSAAPREWNTLPSERRSLDDLAVFKKQLKTYYFTVALNDIYCHM